MSSQPSDKHAGEWESIFVHLVDNLFDEDIIQFAAQWDQIGELNQEERTALQKFAFLCKSIDNIAHIKQNHQTTPDARPALPLDCLINENLHWVRPDSNASQNAWLAAFGLGETTLKAAEGTLTLTPAATTGKRDVIVNLHQTDLEIPSPQNGSTPQPYFTTRLEAGPFEMRCGSATVISDGPDAGKISVEGYLPKGSTLCSGALTYHPKPPPLSKASDGQKEPSLPSLNFKPRLTADVKSRLYFILDGSLPRLDRIEWPSLKIAFGIPNLPSSLTSLRQAFEKAKGSLAAEAGKLLQQINFAGLFAEQGRRGAQALPTFLNSETANLANNTLQTVEALSVQEGSLAAQVRTTTYQGPPLPDEAILKKLLSNGPFQIQKQEP